MSKKAFKSQASSSRAVSAAFGRASDGSTFGSGFGSSAFGAVASSPLSYVYEPPDLSGLSDPNIVVAFKNVQKKDGTTKAKALEEIHTYASSLPTDRRGLEEAMLEAWIKVYPRISIDSSRRVRQLAHVLQGQIALSCGKRMAKHMPAIVASWLAGLYDSDKSVSRAANESFNRVFSSEEKRTNVWRVYQPFILEYSRNVIVNETATTLSDERVTSPDDTSAKYSRVVGAAIMMVASLLENSPDANLEKSSSLLDEFLVEEKLWKLATHDDPFVRRALYRLLSLTLFKHKNSLNPSTISANILTSGLNTNQSGSAFEFAKTITVLSKELPDVWTVHYSGSGKKSAQSRLIHFLKRGSHGGPPDFWSSVSSLLSNLPSSILTGANVDGGASKTDDGIQIHSRVLSALREGINNKDEGRINQGSAWTTYLDAFELVQASLPEPADLQQLYKEFLFPIFLQYVRPLAEQSSWTISGAQQKTICQRACNIALSNNAKVFEEEWQTLSTKIIEDLRISQPEQSKEYAKSQESISAETDRWYQLHASLMNGEAPAAFGSMVGKTVSSEITSALDVIKGRKGKPYGAAAAVDQAIRSIPTIVLSDALTRETLVDFANDFIPDLILSPSAKYLIQILSSLGDEGIVSQTYERCMQRMTESSGSEAKSIALQTFISSTSLANTKEIEILVINNLNHALENDDETSWKLVLAAIQNPAAPKSLTDDLLANMVGGLSIDTAKSAGLHGLEMAAKQRESVVKDFALSQKGSSLLSALLSLSESNDETISKRAKGLSSLVERLMVTSGSSAQAITSLLEMIDSGINIAGVDSLPVDVLVSQAQRLFEQASSDEKPDVAARLLPDLAQWTKAIEPFITLAPHPSLAITNPLGGALSLISTSSIPEQQPVPRDAHGYSSVFRMAWYTTKLIDSTEVFEYIAGDHKALICKNLGLFLQLAGDNLSINGCMPLWHSADSYQEAEIIDLIAETQDHLASWLRAEASLSSFVPVVQEQLLNDASRLTATSYYNARAYATMTAELVEIYGRPSNVSDTGRLKGIRKSADAFASAAYLTCASSSKELQKLRNELLADLTDHQFSSNLEEGLRKLVLLSCIFYDAVEYVAEIPQQRLVFFVKHAVQQLKLVQPTSVIAGQILSVLAVVLPKINGIYGEFWADILGQIEHAGLRMSGDESLYAVHASLRLLWLLKRPYMQEANDDLLDAWNEGKVAIGAALVVLMTQLADLSDESHQPLRTVNQLLVRQLNTLSKDLKVEAQTLYPVLASESAGLQQAAYELLHEHIPSAQEQISVDKALSAHYVVQLPQELLSLILTAPTMDYLAESNFERTMPSNLRSFLMSWKLTFDHWQNASYKVQTDYVSALQEGTYVQDFLDLAFNILINARTKPVDASKFEIEDYAPRVEVSPEKETHWLFIHLYYLCLRHLPSITKTWWRDSTSRQLNLDVSSWTEKYISPLIISSELSTITNWGPSQATADQPMTIKVSPTAREITASIPIDEQTMTIAIHLPKSYPLARAEVSSVHRVAVAEKKWNFWLINAQGVINFSSGGAGEGNALIDGLMAWRKNVTAAMKGQTECAICYSVVGADRQLPSKRCQTCKNTFHSSCLFRWFKSSNSSSCPLCRNAFHYS